MSKNGVNDGWHAPSRAKSNLMKLRSQMQHQPTAVCTSRQGQSQNNFIVYPSKENSQNSNKTGTSDITNNNVPFTETRITTGAAGSA
jgi:hypothetical protein